MVRETAIAGHQQTSKKIHDLKPGTSYLISVYATTRVGQGVETTVQATTAKLLRTLNFFTQDADFFLATIFRLRV
jgi:hypothetical protein